MGRRHSSATPTIPRRRRPDERPRTVRGYGIRTHGALARLPDYQSGPLSRSGNPDEPSDRGLIRNAKLFGECYQSTRDRARRGARGRATRTPRVSFLRETPGCPLSVTIRPSASSPEVLRRWLGQLLADRRARSALIESLSRRIHHLRERIRQASAYLDGLTEGAMKVAAEPWPGKLPCPRCGAPVVMVLSNAQ
jgi:hypothetical protein